MFTPVFKPIELADEATPLAHVCQAGSIRGLDTWVSLALNPLQGPIDLLSAEDTSIVFCPFYSLRFRKLSDYFSGSELLDFCALDAKFAEESRLVARAVFGATQRLQEALFVPEALKLVSKKP